MKTLRELAQAVVDAHAAWSVASAIQETRFAYYDALRRAGVTNVDSARAILAALDAADAQGYARAMGEVVERADHSADYTGWSDYALGHRDAHERLAVWARERLPAAAEKERGG